MQKIKIVCFSDTHNQHRKLNLPSGDIHIFSGDIMQSGYKERELIDFLDWYSLQDSEVKILVAGNHDRWIENYPEEFKELLKRYPNITYLNKESVKVAGINIYGIPDTHYFFNWAFNRTEHELNDIAEDIPLDTNILITHGPAFSILDTLENKASCGETHWYDKINYLDDLILHVSGHIHSGYGKTTVDVLENGNTYTAINCAVLNEQYELQNEPITFELVLE